MYLLGTLHFVPTRWFLASRRHYCLVYSYCVLWGGGGGYVGYIRKALKKGYLEHPQVCMLY